MNKERQGLLIKEKWERIIKHIQTNVLPNVPTMHRDTIGRKLLDELWNSEELLIRIEMGRDNRKELLRSLDIKKDMIMVMIRICYAIGIINHKLYQCISESLTEIGKMIGGLTKASKDKFSNQSDDTEIISLESLEKSLEESSALDKNCPVTENGQGKG